MEAGRSINGGIATKGLVLKGIVKQKGGTSADTKWGTIKGDIDDQNDLMVELHDRDNNALSVQEIESILYLN